MVFRKDWIYFFKTIFCNELVWLISWYVLNYTAQKMKFSIKDFFSKVTKSAGNCGWAHLLKKSLIENFFFCAVLSFSVGRIFDRLCNFLTIFSKLKVIYFIVNNKPSQSLFWETYLQMWINQWRESQVSKESVGYISVMMFFWCVVVIAGIRLCVKLYKNFVGYLANSVISDWNIKNNLCRTIVSLLGFSCKYISRYLGRFCRI